MLKLITGQPEDINVLMRNVLGEISKRYDVRSKDGYNVYGAHLNQAKEIANVYNKSGTESTVVSSLTTPTYDDNLITLMTDLDLYVKSTGELYVLSRENDTYKAAYGDKGDFTEVTDSNPAKALCLAFLKFKGEL